MKPQRARELYGKRGESVVTYAAANGHRMQYWESVERPGKPARASAWEAWCAPDCPACEAGMPLPDW